ncbi:hypothetical protein BKA67DRAFT_369806 [Truncatella angustata]|uniref:Uncharacterized protein n=1 Tax=Truncatella angustata TaxID=152316 RepID=A0A9P8UF33_9PEZI|nr:uncharacterized protein BKA67DRAFT_369806 [Truncatella angustata]KAH6648663.1 hypothetical protein BKA67DRAFT_369806 [Truncatella angustata]
MAGRCAERCSSQTHPCSAPVGDLVKPMNGRLHGWATRQLCVVLRMIRSMTTNWGPRRLGGPGTTVGDKGHLAPDLSLAENMAHCRYISADNKSWVNSHQSDLIAKARNSAAPIERVSSASFQDPATPAFGVQSFVGAILGDLHDACQNLCAPFPRCTFPNTAVQ